MSSSSTVGSITSQRERVKTSLANLKTLISLIPEAAPIGDPSGPLVQNFSDLDLDSEEGPYYALDRAWVRTFQVPPEQQERLISRGQFGVEYVYNCLLTFAELPSMEANNCLFLLSERVESLNRLVARVTYQVYKQNGLSFTAPVGNPGAAAPAGPFTAPVEAANPKEARPGKRKLRRDSSTCSDNRLESC
ncbi:hypothetical protein BC628DRAFT_322714 [Trametes gibbosa]|nr:hypothetical protein BC628DRAFT_322714 [Trametes gibbosa]